MSAIEIVSTLEAAARRGKMAGFQRLPGPTPTQGDVFAVSDFGTPFESVLLARAQPSIQRATGCELSFGIRLRSKLIWVFAVVLIATVWPGVWLTDSMLKTYFSGYDFATWKWYLPLTAPFVPLALWTAIKRSRASAQVEAMQIIERIRQFVGAPDSGAPQSTGRTGVSGGMTKTD